MCEKVMTIEDRLAFRNGLPPRKAVSAPSGGQKTWAVPESTVTAGGGDGKSAELLEIFGGETPVYVFFEDTQKVSLAPRSMWVFPNDVLLRQLAEVLGESNVKLVE